MRIIIADNYQGLSRKAAEIIKRQIVKKPDSVLGLATGSTPVGLYKELIELYKKEKLDFSRIVTFNLDEYIGLGPNHPQSYNFFMRNNLFQWININPKNIFIPDGTAKDTKKYCQWYEKKIETKGGIDLQVLGIGRNGHIGFNEPYTGFDSITRAAPLSAMTARDNARFFKGASEVPRKAITMGIAAIMKAKQILLLVSGAGKANIIYQALKGPITEKVPASILQKHWALTVILDKGAGRLLKTI